MDVMMEAGSMDVFNHSVIDRTAIVQSPLAMHFDPSL
jgi:hypothetical protein